MVSGWVAQTTPTRASTNLDVLVECWGASATLKGEVCQLLCQSQRCIQNL